MQSNTKKKIKHRVVGQKQITWFCIAMLAFPILHIIVFDLFGNFEGLLLIFKTYDYDNMEYVWLWNKDLSVFYNFKQGWKLYFGAGIEGAAYGSAGSSIGHNIIYFLVGLPTLFTGYMCGYIVFKKFPSTSAIYFIYFIPSILSTMVMMQVLNALLGDTLHILYAKNFGRLNPLIEEEQIEIFNRYDRWNNQNLSPLYNEKTALPVLCFYMMLNSFIGGIPYTVGLMSQTSHDLIEYGRLEGLSYWQEFIHVVMPVMWPVFSMSFYGILVAWISASAPLYELYGSGAERNVPESVKSLSYFIQVNTLHRSQNGDAQVFYCYSTAMTVLIGYSKLPIVYATTKLVNLFDPMREKRAKKEL